MFENKKRAIKIMIAIGVVIMAAIVFFVVDFSTTDRIERPGSVVIDLENCPVQPCIKKIPEETEPVVKKEIKKTKPKKKWDPFRKPWETG